MKPPRRINVRPHLSGTIVTIKMLPSAGVTADIAGSMPGSELGTKRDVAVELSTLKHLCTGLRQQGDETCTTDGAAGKMGLIHTTQHPTARV